jgi:hypothetical protein
MAIQNVPWDLLIREGLRLVETARQAKAERSGEQARAAASGQATSSVETLRRRLDEAEAQNRRDAEVAEQMAEQVRLLSAAADELRGRTRLALWLAGGALALAAAALVALLATL